MAQADLLLKGETAYITKGDTLYEDGAAGEQFDLCFPIRLMAKAGRKFKRKCWPTATDVLMWCNHAAAMGSCPLPAIYRDWETIVALPTELFYNTGIATYIWLVRNNKPSKQRRF